MSNARQGWNAAQLASERPLPGRKSHAPVGTPVVIDWGGGTVDVVHKCCGYHVCSCLRNIAVADPPTGSAALRSIYNSPIRFGEPESALLNYDQVVEAAWKKVRCVSTGHVATTSGSLSESEQKNARYEVVEPKAELLTYDQAVAACREGKTVKCVIGLHRCLGREYLFSEGEFLMRCENDREWRECRFPNHTKKDVFSFKVVP